MVHSRSSRCPSWYSSVPPDKYRTGWKKWPRGWSSLGVNLCSCNSIVKEYSINQAREVLTAVLLVIQVSRDVILCCLVSGFGRFEGLYCRHLQVQIQNFFWRCLIIEDLLERQESFTVHPMSLRFPHLFLVQSLGSEGRFLT